MLKQQQMGFSGLQKKKQLQAKRERKANQELVSQFSQINQEIVDLHFKDSLISIVRDTSLLVYNENLYSSSLDIPIRPQWSSQDTKESLELREEIYFKQYLQDIFKSTDNIDNLSWFEMNLNVWRQLWRVFEISDIILFVVDIRHPILHFPKNENKQTSKNSSI